jgi:hypothetical protein
LTSNLFIFDQKIDRIWISEFVAVFVVLVHVSVIFGVDLLLPHFPLPIPSISRQIKGFLLSFSVGVHPARSALANHRASLRLVEFARPEYYRSHFGIAISHFGFGIVKST